MMKFIRKYEWYLYLLITLIIIISFSFFGTYGAQSTPPWWEETAFTTVTGRKVTRGELEEMVLFLSTDLHDRRMTGPYMGPNFLNDGVIAEDLLASSIAIDLILAKRDLFEETLKEKKKREAGFRPYVHPRASMISAETQWNYFNPALLKELEAYQKEENPLSQTALEHRINLYLAERNLPAPLLRHLLMMQEDKMSWIEKDEELPQRDLALFGYHRLDDWFGSTFMRLAAAFIINAAEIAEQKGYRVSREEVEARLIRNSDISFQELKERGLISHNNSYQYLEEELRLLRLDFPKAVKLWEKVVLFRRLFHDIRNSEWIEKETFSGFQTAMSVAFFGELYKLPDSLVIGDIKELAEVEAYFDALFLPAKNPLFPPTETKSLEEVIKKAPELVKKVYRIKVKGASENEVSIKITLPELLSWQIDKSHFALLQKEFPELGQTSAKTDNERLSQIESLAVPIRQRVDRFSKTQLIQSHPEWIEMAMSQAPEEEKVIELLWQGGKPPLPGITDRQDFLKALDANGGPFTYKGSGGELYQIEVIERPKEASLLTLEEARKKGLLTEIVQKKMEPFFAKSKESHPEWKNLKDSIHSVLAEYYKPLLQEVEKELKKRSIQRGIAATSESPDLIASLRFAPFVDQVRKERGSSPWVAKDNISTEGAKESSLQSQFLFHPLEVEWSRSEIKKKGDEAFSLEKLNGLKPHESTALSLPISGKIAFFVFLEKKNKENQESEIRAILTLRDILGTEKERKASKELIQEMIDKKGLSLDTRQASEEI